MVGASMPRSSKGIQKIGDRLNQQATRLVAIIHQKPEIAEIAGKQDIRLAGVCGAIDGTVLLWQSGRAVLGAASGDMRRP